MSEFILNDIEKENISKFFYIISKNNKTIKPENFDNFEKIIEENIDLNKYTIDINNIINDITYFSAMKMDIKIKKIDNSLINKIVKINKY
jgi:hypothetical protein